MFTSVLTVAVVALSLYQVIAVPVADAACSRTYKVVAGDTCDAISAAQGASTYQILLNNPTVNTACDNLWVDQILCLASEGHDCTTLHTIVEGDTCEGILNDAGITLDTLRANNGNVDEGCTNVYPGEVLCTANTLIYTGSN